MVLARRDVLIGGLAASLGWKQSVATPPTSIDAFIETKLFEAGIPGAAVGFAKDGEALFAQGYGYADRATQRRVTSSTLFHIASVTKTVTATAVMKLVEEGKLALDAPIGRYLDFPVVNPVHPDVPIRIRHLLTHTSSITEDVYQKVDFRVLGRDADLPLDQFLKDLLVPGGRHYSANGCFSKDAPGTRWEYVNTGYALLGYIAGSAAGEDLRTYLDRSVFQPLGIHQLAWKLSGISLGSAAMPYDDADGPMKAVAPVALPDWPAGMLRASVGDFTRFIAMAANQGKSGSVRTLTGESVDQMLAMRSFPAMPTWLSGQGLGWAESPLDGVKRPNHWGGDPGVFTAAYLDPPTRSGVVIFTNATATAPRKDAVKAIAAKLFAEGV